MAQDPVRLLAEADKAYSSASSGFSWFGSKTEKLENAAELYIKAGAAFRVRREYQEAGMAYEKAATIQGTQLSEPDDMANTLQDAFKAYRNTSPKDAARCLSQAIDHYISKGNLRRAATQQENLASLYENIGDVTNARLAFAAAAQWMEDDGAPANANKLNLKAGQFAAMAGDFPDAIQRFEHVVQQSLSNNALKYSVPKHLLSAGICHLALDIIGAKRALESYLDLYPPFSSGNEYPFLADLFEIVERVDSHAFEVRCDPRLSPKKPHTPLESWQKTILDKMKNALVEEEKDEFR